MKILLKRIICIVLLLTLICFSGCNNNKPQNYITPKSLSEENENDSNLEFEYNTVDTYKNIDFWIEVYKNGTLVDSRVAGKNFIYNEDKALDGETVITIENTPDFEWTITCTEGDYKGTDVSEQIENKTDYKSGGYSSITEPIEIENEKEIILYASVFSEDSKIIKSFGDLQNILSSGFLDDYDFSFLIKCKFSK